MYNTYTCTTCISSVYDIWRRFQFDNLAMFKKSLPTLSYYFPLLSLFCQVWIHDGNSTLDEDYDLCAQTSNVAEVPSAGYFGISAATGGLSVGLRKLCFFIFSKCFQIQMLLSFAFIS